MSSEVAKIEEAKIIDQSGAPLKRSPVSSDATSIIQVIDRAARDPSVDMDKMERLLEMHERVMAREARQAFNEALRAAQAEMPAVLRDAKNETTRSTYARLETLSARMNPIITKHGFSTTFGTAEPAMQGHYRVTCELSHVAGHSQSYHADVPADGVGMKGTPNKTPTHAFGSSLSYGRRYLKMLIFDVATTDDDDGQKAGAGEPINEKQLATIRELIDETGADIERFCQYLKVEALPDIPASAYSMAIKALESKRAKS